MSTLILNWSDTIALHRIISVFSALVKHYQYALAVRLTPGWYFHTVLTHHSIHNVATALLLSVDELESNSSSPQIRNAIQSMVELTKVESSLPQVDQDRSGSIQADVTSVIEWFRAVGAHIVLHDNSNGSVPTPCHSSLFQHAVSILLSNAHEASRTSTPIRVRISNQRKKLLVIIQDHGTGMGTLEKLQCTWFGWSSKKHGSGLGLATAKWIIEKYCRGRLKLVSAKNVGTTITCQFAL